MKLKDCLAIIESSKRKGDYEIYHKTYSAAIAEALDYAKTLGYETDPEETARLIGIGPRKPAAGKYDKFSIPVTKNGKPRREHLQIQVYGLDDGRYELTCYVL